MKFVYLTHSLKSCWNHGNAHFVRGVVRALARAGHDVDVCEPENGWSLTNLKADQGTGAVGAFSRAFPDLDSRFYRIDDVEALTDGVDVIVVHEWTAPEVIALLGRMRRRGPGFLLLFHDTHHRAVSDPQSIDRAALEDYDGVLAFGESLSIVYRDWGFRAFTWHEAADVSHFYPRQYEDPEGVVWIGNWGDDERTAELESFLFRPVVAEGLPLTVRGVRYPPQAKARLNEICASYDGWIANVDAPDLFARHRMTVHVPRSFYIEKLPGIPTIRVFEALACGIPLASAWWPDQEGLFQAGEDFLIARSSAEMQVHMRALQHDADLRAHLSVHGLRTVRARHTCGHRAAELIDIVDMLRQRQPARATA